MSAFEHAKEYPTYGKAQYNPWETHINEAAKCDNEIRFFPDPFLGAPKTPPAGFALPPQRSRVMSRYQLPQDSTIPWHQARSSLPGKPPYAVCPTHRTGRTSLGTPWDDSQAPTERSGYTAASGLSYRTGSHISKRTRSVKSGSWRSSSSMALVSQIKASNDELQGELRELKSIVQGTNARLSAFDDDRQVKQLPSARKRLTSETLKHHQRRPRKTVLDTARTGLSGILSASRDDLRETNVARQEL